jgi:hypothetical protein
VWCPRCCAPVSAPSNRGICWNHLGDAVQCRSCMRPTIESFITRRGEDVAWCGNCMPQAMALTMSLKHASPLLPELIRHITDIAISSGCTSWIKD